MQFQQIMEQFRNAVKTLNLLIKYRRNTAPDSACIRECLSFMTTKNDINLIC